MSLSSEMVARLTKLLAPSMPNQEKRQSLLVQAFGVNQSNLCDLVDYQGDALTFIRAKLLPTLDTYGEVKPGKPAIVVLLESIGPEVGFDKHQEIRRTIQAIELSPLLSPLDFGLLQEAYRSCCPIDWHSQGKTLETVEDLVIDLAMMPPRENCDRVLLFIAYLCERANIPNREQGALRQWGEKLGDFQTACDCLPTKAHSNLPIPLVAANLPVLSEPEQPGGAVKIASEFYVERPPIESCCFKEILREGALIRIKAPPQMGKTSLLALILDRARRESYKTIYLSFQSADNSIFSNLDTLLKWFCAVIADALKIPDWLDDFWVTGLGSKMNCINYFERYLLRELDVPLAIGLDEVDLVFQNAGIASDFLAMLRLWYEEGKSCDTWKKLRLVVVHSTELYIGMNQSPFNVGLPIELPEFSSNQLLDLARRHGLNWGMAQVEQLMAAIGGHPHLARLAMYHIYRGDLTLEQLLEVAPTEAGIYGDHLRRHWWNLSQHPELADAIARLASSERAVKLEPSQVFQVFQLMSMGLIRVQRNEVTLSCNLYRQYFRERFGSRG